MAQPTSPPLLSRAFAAIVAMALRSAPGDALRALRSLLRGRKVRAWNLLCNAAARSPGYYQRWIEVAEPQVMRRLCGTGTAGPVAGLACLILGNPGDTPADVVASQRSLGHAFGPDLRVWTNVSGCPDIPVYGVPPCTTPGLGSVLSTLPDDWHRLLILRAGDEVSRALAAVLAKAFAVNSKGMEPDILFWDEDRTGREGRHDPWVKPGWDPLLHQARNMLVGCSVVSRAAITQWAGDIPCTFDGAASAIDAASARPGKPAPHHFPAVLTHRCKPAPARPTPPEPGDPPRWPRVSILIPTRDRPELLSNCLDGLKQLEYPGETEWIIIDNGSSDPAALDLLDHWRSDARVKVLSMPGPFNFSSLNNRAMAAARGEFLCLLNNDIEALDGAWLTMMVRRALEPGTGAVGALLLYPDGSVQHAGVAIGVGGAAGHLMRGHPVDRPQQVEWFRTTREVSAVTAACLVVSKENYQSVGGLDEAAFAVAFNDVDFCLKLKQAGLRNIFVAEAVLVHHESKSRGSDMLAENVERFQRELGCLQARWQTGDYDDPHFSPLFSRSNEQCLLAFPA